MVNAIQAEIDRDEELEQNHQNEVNNKLAELERQYRYMVFVVYQYSFQKFVLRSHFYPK